MTSPKPPNMWHHLVDFLGTSFVGIHIYKRIGPPIDRWLLRKSGGRLYVVVDKPMALLTTIGAKTGQTRQTPVFAIPHESRYIVIASNFGSKTHPAWYYNMVKNPAVELTVRGRTYPLLARLAQAQEREDLWNIALAYYTGYDAYKSRSEDYREIPIFVLEPREA